MLQIFPAPVIRHADLICLRIHGITNVSLTFATLLRGFSRSVRVRVPLTRSRRSPGAESHDPEDRPVNDFFVRLELNCFNH